MWRNFWAVVLLSSLSAVVYSTETPAKIPILGPKEYKEVEQGASRGSYLVHYCGVSASACQKSEREFGRVADALKGFVNVYRIEDEEVAKQQTGYDKSKLPAIWFYMDGKGKQYKGDVTKSEEILSFAFSGAKSGLKRRLTGVETDDEDDHLDSKKEGKEKKDQKKKDQKDSSSSKPKAKPKLPVELTDDNFDKTVMADKEHTWFVQFYAPWCGHCKAMTPEWQRVARDAPAGLKVGRVDATVHTDLARRFDIRGFPTIYLFPEGRVSSQPIPYQGERDAANMLAFAREYVKEVIVVDQLTSHEQFEEECSNSLCLFAFLPAVEDSGVEGRKNYLETLAQVTKSNSPLKYFWLEGGVNFDLEEKLHLQFGYPAVISIRSDKDRYAIHRGTFTVQSLKSFISSLMVGQANLVTLPSPLPKFKRTPQWDEAAAAKQQQKQKNEEL